MATEKERFIEAMQKFEQVFNNAKEMKIVSQLTETCGDYMIVLNDVYYAYKGITDEANLNVKIFWHDEVILNFNFTKTFKTPFMELIKHVVETKQRHYNDLRSWLN